MKSLIINQKNFVYYGRINSIDVVSGGKNYDVVNPPVLRIKDENDAGTIIGTGATGFLAVNGQFDEVRVLDPGFDYLDVPKVKISGGNPTRNAVAEAKLSVVPHEVTFNSTGIGSVELVQRLLLLVESDSPRITNSGMEKESYIVLLESRHYLDFPQMRHILFL